MYSRIRLTKRCIRQNEEVTPKDDDVFLILRGYINKIVSTALNIVLFEKMKRMKVVALVIIFQKSSPLDSFV